LILLGFAWPAAPALAQSEGGPIESRYEITVGSYFTSLSTILALRATDGILGTSIDFEEDLGSPDREDVFRGDFLMRFGRHEIRAGYYQVSRRATRIISREITWGDQTFESGATVRSDFKSSFPQIDYTYWALSRPRVAAGVTAGLVVFGLETSLGLADGPVLREGPSVDTVQLVPLVGGEFRGLITSWLLLRAKGGVIHDLENSLVWSGAAALEPRVYKALWLGVSLRAFHVETAQDGIWAVIDGEGSLHISGLEAYARFTF
jgi:hypothetical protein